MMILRTSAEFPSQHKIEKAAETLKNGGVIIYPTDTIYSFGCDVYNMAAIQRIARIKGKEKTHFSIVCHDLSQVAEFTGELSTPTFRIMKKTLPGPFTYILKANKNVPKLFGFNKHTIGIRIPNNNIALELVKAVGNPIISASVLDEEDDILDYLTDPKEIFERYKSDIDAMIDAGAGDNEASTVVDFSNAEPHIIRQGKGILPV